MEYFLLIKRWNLSWIALNFYINDILYKQYIKHLKTYISSLFSSLIERILILRQYVIIVSR